MGVDWSHSPETNINFLHQAGPNTEPTRKEKKRTPKINTWRMDLLTDIKRTAGGSLKRKPRTEDFGRLLSTTYVPGGRSVKKKNYKHKCVIFHGLDIPTFTFIRHIIYHVTNLVGITDSHCSN